jgi:hypothetical protein
VWYNVAEVSRLAAICLKKTVEKDGEILLTGLPFKKGEHVVITVEAESIEEPRRHMTAKDLLESGLVGIWADREDIGDSSEFARQLREKVEKRRPRK